MSLLMTLWVFRADQMFCGIGCFHSWLRHVPGWQDDGSDLLWEIAWAALGIPQLFPPFGLAANYWKALSTSLWLLQPPKIFTNQRWVRTIECSKSLPAQVLCPVCTCWFGLDKNSRLVFQETLCSSLPQGSYYTICPIGKASPPPW